MQRFERRGWVEHLTHTFLAWLAVLIFGALILLFVALLFLFAAQPSLAATITVPPACVAIAKQYGMTTPEKMERSEIEHHLNSVQVIGIGILVPAVRRCRAALKLELKK